MKNNVTHERKSDALSRECPFRAKNLARMQTHTAFHFTGAPGCDAERWRRNPKLNAVIGTADRAWHRRSAQ